MCANVKVHQAWYCSVLQQKILQSVRVECVYTDKCVLYHGDLENYGILLAS